MYTTHECTRARTPTRPHTHLPTHAVPTHFLHHALFIFKVMQNLLCAKTRPLLTSVVVVVVPAGTSYLSGQCWAGARCCCILHGRDPSPPTLCPPIAPLSWTSTFHMIAHTVARYYPPFSLAASHAHPSRQSGDSLCGIGSRRGHCGTP